MSNKGLEAAILRELCMNSRAEVTDIARKAGCSRETVRSRMRQIEKEMRLWYTVELDEEKLGLPFRHLISVKCHGAKPTAKLQKLITGSDIPQFFAECEGEFDILIYAVAPTHTDYLKWEYSVRKAIADKIVFWKVSSAILFRLGFFPLKAGGLNNINLSKTERDVLVSLHKNARTSLREIAAGTGNSLMQVRHAYQKLLGNGVIRRFTAIVRKPPIATHSMGYFVHHTFNRGFEKKSDNARRLIFDNRGPLINKYCMVVETAGVADGFDWITANDVKSAYGSVKEMELAYEGGMRTESAEIKRIIVGEAPLRSMSVGDAYNRSEWK